VQNEDGGWRRELHLLRDRELCRGSHQHRIQTGLGGDVAAAHRPRDRRIRPAGGASISSGAQQGRHLAEPGYSTGPVCAATSYLNYGCTVTIFPTMALDGGGLDTPRRCGPSSGGGRGNAAGHSGQAALERSTTARFVRTRDDGGASETGSWWMRPSRRCVRRCSTPIVHADTRQGRCGRVRALRRRPAGLHPRQAPDPSDRRSSPGTPSAATTSTCRCWRDASGLSTAVFRMGRSTADLAVHREEYDFGYGPSVRSSTGHCTAGHGHGAGRGAGIAPRRRGARCSGLRRIHYRRPGDRSAPSRREGVVTGPPFESPARRPD